MKIGIIGNGKMGQLISTLAEKRGHKIVFRSNSSNPIDNFELKEIDIAIDFSTPKSAYKNISHAINNGIPTISGTTGWLDKIQDIQNLCNKKNGSFLHSSNFSIGMNLFFELNKKLSTLIKSYNYDITIHEKHHKNKLDIPSGTAIKLSNDINNISNNEVNIKSTRMNDIIGEHSIMCESLNDTIEIKHIAKNRKDFAVGAIIAAEWLINKKGVFGMTDVLKGL